MPSWLALVSSSDKLQLHGPVNLIAVLTVSLTYFVKGLSPDTNMDKARADMIVDGVMDIRAKRTKYHFECDPAVKVSSAHF